MGTLKNLAILVLTLTALHAQPIPIAKFQGTGTTSITAMASDADGNLLIAGTTNASDLPTKNGAQPQIGEVPMLRSLDAGKSWQRVPNARAGTTDITAHPANPEILLAAGIYGIDKTTDGGRTWRNVFSWKSDPYMYVHLAMDPANPALIYAVRAPWMFLASSDGGETWQERAIPRSVNENPTRQLWVDPNGSGTVLAGMAASIDRGLTWRELSQPGDYFPHSSTLRLDPHHPGWIYAITTRGATFYTYVSTNWGATWKEVMGFFDLTFDPDVPNVLYALASRGGLFVSRNNAATWEQIAESQLGSLAAISRQCAGGALVATNGPSVTANAGFGQNWGTPQLTGVQRLSAGPGCTLFAIRATTYDAFVAKLTPQGEVMWSTFLGGMDRDEAVSIASGPDGSVYVAGNTASEDFPAASVPTGPAGRRNVFVTRFDAAGTLTYATVFGEEFDNTPTTLSVDEQGNAYVAGGATFSGFANKLDPAGQILYKKTIAYNPRYGSASSFDIGIPKFPLPFAAANDGTALVAGNGDSVSRISADGASIEPIAKFPGLVLLLSVDKNGDVYATGQAPPSASSSQTCFYGYVNHQTTYVPAADTYITKLKAGTLEPIFTRRLAGTCRTQPVDMKISPNGEIMLGIWTFGQVPLRDPVQATLGGKTAVVRIGADGAELLFSSYLSGAAGIALGQNGTLFAGANQTSKPATVVQLPVLRSETLAIESISQSVSGFRESVRAGSLATITGRGFVAEAIDLGLDYGGPLPRELGGVQVLFDGIAAELLQVAPDHVVFVVPGPLASDSWTSVQVVTASGKSTPFLVNSESFLRPALLTRAFPYSPAGTVDAVMRNADGTENSAANPAAPGSTVTLYATGVEDPAKIDLYWAPKPFEPDPRPSPFPTGPGPIAVSASRMPGFLSQLYQIRFRIPTAMGPGVAYLPPPGLTTRVEIAIGNTVGIWIR